MSEFADLQQEDVEDQGQEIASDGIQIVTFSLNGARFAAPMSTVQEIVRVPSTVKVPMASCHLSGLANLRGRVLPIFQCRSMMGMPWQEVEEASRVLVLRLNNPVGLVVDRVHSVMSISPDQLDKVTQSEQSEHSEWLSGMVRHESGLILLLDVDKLVQIHLVHNQMAGTRLVSDNSTLGASDDEDETNDEWQLVSFEVDGQEYAAPIERVQEIVQAPESFTAIPHSPHSVLGVMVLRSRLLPLVSLRSLFGLEEIGMHESHRVVVLRVTNGLSVGVVMDRVNEVLRVPRSLVEPIPNLFATQSSVRHLSSMCRLNEGKRLVSVLEVESLLEQANFRAEAGLDDQSDVIGLGDDDMRVEEEGNEDEGQVVVFKLGGEEFGVNIHSVQEIVRVPEQLTHIPQSPDFLEGVINLRGSVLPVVDQRRRMGIASGQRNDRQRIMVYLMDGVRTGFIVDSVTEVLRIESRFISKNPADCVHSTELLPLVANLPDNKRMILLIDPQALLSGSEIGAIREPQTVGLTDSIGPSETSDVGSSIGLELEEMKA
ncbi:MAG: chemotaxis protein CheW [Limnobacter sp.]|nr:chemotaxis protein CheW [Limnobacter sp.]